MIFYATHLANQCKIIAKFASVVGPNKRQKKLFQSCYCRNLSWF